MARSRNPTSVRKLVIVRDDHIGDPIGAIFLEPDDGEDGILRRIAEYLGAKARILHIGLAHDRVTVEVEASPFAEESGRLASAAADLHRKGAPRNALAMFEEALALDPLNGQALYQMGLLRADLNNPRQALLDLRRAREVLGDGVELLHSLGRVCVTLERLPSAIGYLEAALELEPDNQDIRRDLIALGRKPPQGPRTLRILRRRG